MIVDLAGFAPPGGAVVFEVADQFALFAIDADDRCVCVLELATFGFDDHELSISSGAIPALTLATRFDVLAVGLEREVHVVQQPPDGIGADLNVGGAQCGADRLRGLSRPARPVNRIARHFIFENRFDACQDGGVFFPHAHDRHLVCAPASYRYPHPTTRSCLWRRYADRHPAMRQRVHRHRGQL